MQTITKRVLTQEHVNKGLYTHEENGYIYLYSMHSDKCIAAFSNYETIGKIWEVADKWILNRDLLGNSLKVK